MRRNRLGIGRAGAEVAGAVQRAQQHLDQMDRAAGMEAIGVGGNAAHRVHGHRPADHLIVLAAINISPLDIQFDSLLECHMRHFQRHALNRLGWHATLLGHIGRGIALVKVALGSQRQHSFHRTAVRCDKVTEQRGGGANFHATHKRLFFQIPHQRGACSITQKQSIAFLTRSLHHQPGRIGVAHQEFPIEQLAREQHMHHRQRKQSVHAGFDRHPFIGNGGVAGTHRIDGNELAAVALEFFQADLDRVGRMIFRYAPQNKIFGVIPVGRAKFPERKADGIQARRRHVDRAKTPVSRPVGRAELLRP